MPLPPPNLSQKYIGTMIEERRRKPGQENTETFRFRLAENVIGKPFSLGRSEQRRRVDVNLLRLDASDRLAEQARGPVQRVTATQLRYHPGRALVRSQDGHLPRPEPRIAERMQHSNPGKHPTSTGRKA